MSGVGTPHGGDEERCTMTGREVDAAIAKLDAKDKAATRTPTLGHPDVDVLPPLPVIENRVGERTRMHSLGTFHEAASAQNPGRANPNIETITGHADAQTLAVLAGALEDRIRQDEILAGSEREQERVDIFLKGTL